jgi:hypothetical protein
VNDVFVPGVRSVFFARSPSFPDDVFCFLRFFSGIPLLSFDEAGMGDRRGDRGGQSGVRGVAGARAAFSLWR